LESWLDEDEPKMLLPPNNPGFVSLLELVHDEPSFAPLVAPNNPWACTFEESTQQIDEATIHNRKFMASLPSTLITQKDLRVCFKKQKPRPDQFCVDSSITAN
jgi:hypothetical protein